MEVVPLIEMVLPWLLVVPGQWKRQKNFRLEKTQFRPAQAPQEGPKPLVSLVAWWVVDGDSVLLSGGLPP